MNKSELKEMWTQAMMKIVGSHPDVHQEIITAMNNAYEKTTFMLATQLPLIDNHVDKLLLIESVIESCLENELKSYKEVEDVRTFIRTVVENSLKYLSVSGPNDELLRHFHQNSDTLKGSIELLPN